VPGRSPGTSQLNLIFFTLDLLTKACYAEIVPKMWGIVGYVWGPNLLRPSRNHAWLLVQKRRQTMGMLRIMSRKGDERIVWDNNKASTNDLEALAAIREAERIFNEERARGATAFKVESGKTVERLETFDRTAEQIVMVPRVVGG
jgi:hypothetical protein